jgi:hypothetical protein
MKSSMLKSQQDNKYVCKGVGWEEFSRSNSDSIALICYCCTKSQKLNECCFFSKNLFTLHALRFILNYFKRSAENLFNTECSKNVISILCFNNIKIRFIDIWKKITINIVSDAISFTSFQSIAKLLFYYTFNFSILLSFKNWIPLKACFNFSFWKMQCK